MDLSFLGPTAATIILAGMFLGYIRDKEKHQDAKDTRQEKRDILFATALDNLTETGKDQAKASYRAAKATEQSAQEAKERNGHLAELSNEGTAKLAEMLEKINTVSVSTAASNAAMLKQMRSTATALARDTKLALKANKDAAAALIVAADKVQATPIHIDTQLVDQQRVGVTTNLKGA